MIRIAKRLKSILDFAVERNIIKVNPQNKITLNEINIKIK